MRQLMMLHKLDFIPDCPVPEGFSIRTYEPGDEVKWVEICKHGLCGPDATLDAWRDAILNRETIVPSRDVFFVCRGSEPVATITGYVRPDGRGDIHMVACREDARGHGIGKAMLSHAMKKLKADLPGDGQLVELTTDDFRLPAVVVYLRGGFHPVLYDEGMEERWRAVCAKLGMGGGEMLTEEGEPTGIVI